MKKESTKNQTEEFTTASGSKGTTAATGPGIFVNVNQTADKITKIQATTRTTAMRVGFFSP